MCSPTSSSKKRDGVVVLLVLGITMIASWLALAVLESVRKELAVKASPAGESELRQTAYQLLELSIGVLAEIRRFEGELYSPVQGWAYPLTYAGMRDHSNLTTAIPVRGTGGTPVETAPEFPADPSEMDDLPVEVATGEDLGAEALLAELLETTEESSSTDGFARVITEVTPGENAVQLSPETVTLELPGGLEARVRLFDESGKLSLTATPEARWLLFFEAMGLDESEGRRLTHCLLDWMDPDDDERENGAETETYAQREPPYRAANRTLRDFDELQMVAGFEDIFFDARGIPTEYFIQFRDNVSLYHSSEVNLNSASSLVLKTLAEEMDFDADNVSDFLAGSDQIFGTADDRILRPGLDESSLPMNDEGEPIRLFRPVRFVTAEIAVSAGQSIYTLSAVLDLAEPHPGGIYPFRIVRIVENQPLS